jgi:hypothetical protein
MKRRATEHARMCRSHAAACGKPGPTDKAPATTGSFSDLGLPAGLRQIMRFLNSFNHLLEPAGFGLRNRQGPDQDRGLAVRRSTSALRQLDRFGAVAIRRATD